MISAEMPYEKKYQDVRGKRIAYLEEGQGDPIVLLHGNPTSSYLWRNVVPELEGLGRVIVPDLIGQGDSEKLPASDGPGRYTLETAYGYVDGLLDALGAADEVTFVIHDWGSAIGFMWAERHPGKVKGIAYMEAIVRPVTWADWPDAAREVFQGFRSEKGEEMVLEQNAFVEFVLPTAVLRGLTDAEMEHYRRPFANPEDRQPTLNWPRQIPIEGEPADVVATVESYGRWLEQSDDVPKLFVNAEPGAILVGPQREYCRSWPNQTEVTVKGSHFVQEDSPKEIGQAVAAWYRGL